MKRNFETVLIGKNRLLFSFISFLLTIIILSGCGEEQLASKGDQAFSQGDFPKALEYYEAAKNSLAKTDPASNPNKTETQNLVLEKIENTKASAEKTAKDALNIALSLKKNHEYFSRGSKIQLKEYLEIAQKNASCTDNEALKAQIKETQNDPGIKATSKLFSNSSYPLTKDYMRAGDMAYSEGGFDSAAALYQTAIDLDGLAKTEVITTMTRTLQVARSYRRAKDYKKSLEVLRKMVADYGSVRTSKPWGGGSVWEEKMSLLVQAERELVEVEEREEKPNNNASSTQNIKPDTTNSY